MRWLLDQNIVLTSSTTSAPDGRPQTAGTEVLSKLQHICDQHEATSLSEKLANLAQLVDSDMREVNQTIEQLPAGLSNVEQGAKRLLRLGGKRLRPMCVALAAKLGTGWDKRALHVAIAAELVHNATLLHDDVVDLGDQRRGAPTSRLIYGNAASVFSGDWLLVRALRLVRQTKLEDAFDQLLDVLDEMILAESIQLENRGNIQVDRDRYFQVLEGKTASLFRWALFAGGRVGGLSEQQCQALQTYGNHLGIAFQIVDDMLDYSGDEGDLGKEPFADLREGKVTYPLILAFEHEPSLKDVLHGDNAAEELLPSLQRVLRDQNILQACHDFALEHIQHAIACLDVFEDGEAKRALMTVALATLERKS